MRSVFSLRLFQTFRLPCNGDDRIFFGNNFCHAGHARSGSDLLQSFLCLLQQNCLMQCNLWVLQVYKSRRTESTGGISHGSGASRGATQISRQGTLSRKRSGRHEAHFPEFHSGFSGYVPDTVATHEADGCARCGQVETRTGFSQRRKCNLYGLFYFGFVRAKIDVRNLKYLRLLLGIIPMNLAQSIYIPTITKYRHSFYALQKGEMRKPISRHDDICPPDFAQVAGEKNNGPILRSSKNIFPIGVISKSTVHS